MNPLQVVIIGAGFGGLAAAKALKSAPVEVLLIDQNNYHTFQPLLYQVATAGLDMGDIAHQVRGIFQQQRNLRFRQGTVTAIDQQGKRVLLGDDTIPFDHLILAAGSIYHDFGIPGVKEHAFVLKGLGDAANLRSHILRQFEAVSADPSLLDRGILNFVIVGAGPTGVEMAGAMSELLGRVLPRDYPELDLSRARVMLLEASGKVLPSYHPRSQQYAERILGKRGVKLHLDAVVTRVSPQELELADGTVIPNRTIIWAAGIRGHPLAETLGVALERGRRVRVEADLSLPGRPDMAVIGDLAAARDDGGNLHPQVAQVAIQQGKHAARQLRRRLQGRPTEAFHYFDRGSMAIIGRNAGVAELSRRLGGLRLRGFPGWLAWLFIHLIHLPGHQNRFHALSNWAYNYLTYDRHARLITDMFLTPNPVLAEITPPPATIKSSQPSNGEPPRNNYRTSITGTSA